MILPWASTLALSLAAAAVALMLASSMGKQRIAAPYLRWWKRSTIVLDLPRGCAWIPHLQAVFTALVVGLSVLLSSLGLLIVLPVVLCAPAVWLSRLHRAHKKALVTGLDTFLTTLADTLTTVPNLSEALASSRRQFQQPIRREVELVCREIALGSPLDDALKKMAARLELPGFDAAIGAALLGKRVGGDLPQMLRRIARTTREMERLRGVIQSKTAEGRSQAWVMGAVPPFLIALLHGIDPLWLAPLFNDPIGWILLTVAAVLESIAILLIRRIMAVEV